MNSSSVCVCVHGYSYRSPFKKHVPIVAPSSVTIFVYAHKAASEGGKRFYLGLIKDILTRNEGRSRVTARPQQDCKAKATNNKQQDMT